MTKLNFIIISITNNNKQSNLNLTRYTKEP